MNALSNFGDTTSNTAYHFTSFVILSPFFLQLMMRSSTTVGVFMSYKSITSVVSKVTFRQSEIINEDLVMVRGAKKVITLNKPISVGFTVLESSIEIGELAQQLIIFNYSD